jgi:hypothetical protein
VPNNQAGLGSPSKILKGRDFLIGPYRLLTERKIPKDVDTEKHTKKGEG